MTTLATKSNLARRKFEELALTQVGREFVSGIYPSKHFFERVVERNFEDKTRELLVAALIAYKFFKSTTFEQRQIAVTICGKYVAFDITVGKESGKRMLVMKTIYEIDDVRRYQFDEVL